MRHVIAAIAILAIVLICVNLFVMLISTGSLLILAITFFACVTGGGIMYEMARRGLH